MTSETLVLGFLNTKSSGMFRSLGIPGLTCLRPRGIASIVLERLRFSERVSEVKYLEVNHLKFL